MITPRTKDDRPKTIGIFGGMGPVSSAHLYREILTICQKEYGAVEEGDFPRIILYSLPIKESSNKGFDDLAAALPQLLPVARILEQAGADFMVIPCNTAHCFFRELQASVNVPILNMMDLVMLEGKRLGYRTLGLLATETTVQTALYEHVAEKNGMQIINMTVQEHALITTAIGNVTSGRQSSGDTDRLRSVSAALLDRGAESVILGCTELPLAFSQSDTDIPLLDSVHILAEEAVRFSYAA